MLEAELLASKASRKIEPGYLKLNEKLFKEIYGDDFMLLSKKEILEKQLFGTGAYHPKFMSMLGDYFAVATGDISIMTGGIRNWLSDHGGATEEEMRVPLIVLNDFFPLGTDVNAYVKEALRRLKKKYPWAKRSMFNKHESYAIEEVSGKKEFVNYYTWDDNTRKRYAEGWDGELFIRRIISEQESRITGANKVKEVLDVMPDYGVDCHGWCLERFEFIFFEIMDHSLLVKRSDPVFIKCYQLHPITSDTCSAQRDCSWRRYNQASTGDQACSCCSPHA